MIRVETSLCEILSRRARETPEAMAFCFLEGGERPGPPLTYGELHRRACTIAARLRIHFKPGDRALLLFAPGLAYIEAFFGCLYAGVVAVPAYPPDPSRLGRMLPRLTGIVKDCQPKTVLTTSDLVIKLRLLALRSPSLALLRWLSTDDLNSIPGAEQEFPIARAAHDLAFLQYTSGSTGSPKGVMVTHGNLVNNCETMRSLAGFGPEDRVVSWLPLYHDMGLIGQVLHPVYSGVPAWIMSPMDFLRNPACWLKAISDLKATASGAPNFAYELCAAKVSPERRRGLDLRTWRLAFCGAEPIRESTVRSFIDAFSGVGFSPGSFYPCYGLAEATLMVTGCHRGRGHRAIAVDEQGLKDGEGRESAGSSLQLVSSGSARMPDCRTLIVNPLTRSPCPTGTVGEIWTSSPSVGAGYWGKPEVSEETFRARLSQGEGRFLKTGDLGFLAADGELFVTGRLKDLLIVNGQNHYPSDLEFTALSAHADVRKGCCIAFSVEQGGSEKVVIVAEIKSGGAKDGADPAAIRSAISRAIQEQHQLAVAEVVLIRPGTIPKTTSGKLQRSATREAYLARHLDEVLPRKGAARPESARRPARRWLSERLRGLRRRDAQAIEQVLIAIVAEELAIETSKVGASVPLGSLGLSSIKAVSLAATIEREFKVPFPPALLWQHSSVEALVRFLNRKGAVLPVSVGPSHNRRASDRTVDPIAVVGMACRFPGAEDLESFWRLLSEGRCAIGAIPPSRWDWGALSEPDAKALRESPFLRGGLVERIDRFDSLFFGISPREARLIDPQQRLLLETVWHALEDAGLRPTALRGKKIGVYVGASSGEYAELVQRRSGQMDLQIATGNSHSILANRISYLLDFRGPSQTLDTACSSSLIAIHQAVEAIHRGECEAAIAGGVNLMLTPSLTFAFSRAGMLSPDGLCHTFDERANGYVRGEGIGAVVLKPLSRALADGDPIYGVIRGSAANHGGQAQSLTAPNPAAQAELILSACQRAKVDVGTLSYIEAHGTATPLGDPIELQGIRLALSSATDAKSVQPCSVGSVKTNIGHLEAGAGIAGFIKTMLCLSHRKKVASLHFKKLSSHADLGGVRVEVQSRLESWQPDQSAPLRAGVSAFGFGGANCHVIVEQAPGDSADVSLSPTGQAVTVPLSAKDPERLHAAIQRLHAYLLSKDLPETLTLADLARTLSEGRERLNCRAQFTVRSLDELRQRLAESAVDPVSIDEVGNAGGRRVHGVPGYCFAPARHWVDDAREAGSPIRLHASDFFVRDHVVIDRRVLPGVAYWELVLRALRGRAAQKETNTEAGYELRDVVWMRPLVVSGDFVDADVALRPVAGGFEFEVSSLGADGAATVHCKGSAFHLDRAAEGNVAASGAWNPTGEAVESRDVYARFDRQGLHYGPTFRAMRRLWSEDEVAWSELELDPEARSAAGDFFLHPSLMDAALGTCVGLRSMIRQAPDQVFIPFSTDRVRVYGPVTDACRVRALWKGVGEDLRYEIEVYSGDGDRILARCEGVYVRAVSFGVEASSRPTRVVLKPEWGERPWSENGASEPGNGPILVIDESAQLASMLREAMAPAIVHWWKPEQLDSVAEALGELREKGQLPRTIVDLSSADQPETRVLRHLALFQAWHRLEPALSLSILAASRERELELASLAGFARSLGQLHPGYELMTVALQGEACRPNHAAEILRKELTQGVRGGDELRHIGNRRLGKRLRETTLHSNPTIVRDEGVYLMTGGAGELAVAIARDWMARHRARFVLVGRNPPSEEKKSALDQAAHEHGAVWVFVAADVTDPRAMAQAVRAAQERFGALHGVIHGAGVASSCDAVRATRESYLSVLGPKLAGTRVLDEVTRGVALDFFALLSSTSAWFGDFSAGDYAAANRYLAAYAEERDRLRRAGQRRGATVSMHWPLWKNGGMHLPPEMAAIYSGQLGLGLLPLAEGLGVFEALLSAGENEIGLLYGDATVIRRRMEPVAVKPAQSRDRASAGGSPLEFLKRTLGQALKIDAQVLDADRDLREYGADSLALMELLERVKAQYGVALSPSDVFRNPTLAALSSRISAVESTVSTPSAPLAVVSPAATEPNSVHDLSEAQKALWFLYRMEPRSFAYNIPMGLEIQEAVDERILRRSLASLVQAQSALRTVFFEETAGHPRAEVLENPGVDLEFFDSQELADETVFAQATQEAQSPFDLEAGPLFRARAYRRPGGRIFLMMVAHHIVFDGLSLTLALRQWIDEYARMRIDRRGGRLRNIRPYSEFVRWQKAFLESVEGQAQERYWLSRLEGELPALHLPVDRPRPALKTDHGATHRFRIDPSLAARLREAAKRERATLYSVTLSAFLILAHRLSGQEEVLIGSPALGRGAGGFDDTLGYFVNMLVFRTRLGGDGHGGKTLGQFIAEVQEQVGQGLVHQDYPFPRLVERLKPARDPSRSPIFDVCFVFQNMLKDPVFTGGKGDGHHRYVHLRQQEGQFDLELELMEQESGFNASFKFNPDLFDVGTIERFSRSFLVLLGEIAREESGAHPALSLPWVSPTDLDQVVGYFNHTQRPYDLSRTLMELFERQAGECPEASAVKFLGETWSYAELNARADRVAQLLRARGVRPGERVGIFMERSFEMVLGIYGALKAGAAYVPLEPTYPDDRLRYMLGDAAPRVVLTQSVLHARRESLMDGAGNEAEWIALDSERERWQHEADHRSSQPAEPAQGAAGPSDAAYVIYTSGSTGQPKGVAVPHEGIVNRLIWMQEYLGLKPADRVLQKTPFCFDVSVWEFFWPLLYGGTLVVAEPEGHRDGSYLAETIESEGITILHFVPSMLEVFVEDPACARARTLSKVICSGEALPYSLQEKFFERWPQAELHNLYGPTEASVDVTYWQCQRGDLRGIVPIGFPIANTQIYVVDADLRPVPVGVAGELCIGGIGLAIGYVNKPDLTRERFVEVPFPEAHGYPRRVYRTGDLARYLEDGSVEYLGRLDHQVKIRGFRIELGEIEHRISSCSDVRRCVVVAYAAPGSSARSLVAYLTADPSVADEALFERVREVLQAQLPEYMVPSHWVRMDEIPLSANGKVDRKRLPSPAASSVTADDDCEPRSATEAQVAGAFARILGLSQVPRQKSFFALGGSSLQSIRAVLEINRVLGSRSDGGRLLTRHLYEHQSVESLSRWIDQQEGSNASGSSDLSPDLLREARLDPELRFDAPFRDPDPHCVVTFLTGATGFLGAYLLRDLLEAEESKVYCLVRADSEADGQRRLRANLEKYGLWKEEYAPRAVAVLGDVGRPRWGMAEDWYGYLSGKVDRVVHNAARVNFLQPYGQLRSENVLGTEEAIRFAAFNRLKPLHYVSTVSVFASRRYDRDSYITEDTEPVSEGLYGGYAQSKWVAERMVRAAIDQGLPGRIYRPGTISGDTETGACNADDLLSKLLLGVIDLGAMPTLDRWVEMAPVDVVSRMVVALMRDAKEGSERIFHLSHPQPIHQHELAEFLAVLGYRLELDSFPAWRDRLIAALENPLQPLLPVFAEPVEGGELTQAELTENQPRIRAPSTVRTLARLGLAHPPIDAAMIGRIVDWLKLSLPGNQPFGSIKMK